MTLTPTVSHTEIKDGTLRALPGTDAFMFGVGRAQPSPDDVADIRRIANARGVTFVQVSDPYLHCFVVTTEVLKLYTDGSPTELLNELGNRGLMATQFDCGAT